MSGSHRHTANDVNGRSSTYLSWAQMRIRCRNPQHHAWLRYGGRGIQVCEAWERFEQFLVDMGLRPSLDHSLDRINNDGDYEPGNCRWATRSEQRRNQVPFSPERLAQLAQARRISRERHALPVAHREEMRRLATETRLTLKQIGARFGVSGAAASAIVGPHPRAVWRAIPDGVA